MNTGCVRKGPPRRDARGGLLVEALVALALVMLAGLAALTLDHATRTTLAAAQWQQQGLAALRRSTDPWHPLLEDLPGLGVSPDPAGWTAPATVGPWPGADGGHGPSDLRATALLAIVWQAQAPAGGTFQGAAPVRPRPLEAMGLQWPLAPALWGLARPDAPAVAATPRPAWPRSAVHPGPDEAAPGSDGDDPPSRTPDPRGPEPTPADGLDTAGSGPAAVPVPGSGVSGDRLRRSLTALLAPAPERRARFEAAWAAVPGALTRGGAQQRGAAADVQRQSGALRVDPAVLADLAAAAALRDWIARVVEAPESGSPVGSGPATTLRPLCDLAAVGGADPHLAWRCLGVGPAAVDWLLPHIGLSPALVLCRFEVAAPQGPGGRPLPVAPAPRVHAWIGLGDAGCPPSARRA